MTARDEALLVAIACSKPPTGRARWILELLAGAVVHLTEHTELSRETGTAVTGPRISSCSSTRTAPGAM